MLNQFSDLRAFPFVWSTSPRGYLGSFSENEMYESKMKSYQKIKPFSFLEEDIAE